MALNCLGSGGNREHLAIPDSSFLTLPGSGWTISAMFFPSTAVGVNSFSYIYSQGAPLANVPAINIFLEASSSDVRVIVDQSGGTLVDFNSSNNISIDTWNNIYVRYNGTQIFIHLNGVSTFASPPSIGTVNPTVTMRIGDATHGPGREFNGRIAHVSKWDRDFSSSEATRNSGLLISPAFFHDEQQFHIPIFNSSFNGDELGNVMTTPSGALYGNHAPAIYQGTRSFYGPVRLTPPVTGFPLRHEWSFT